MAGELGAEVFVIRRRRPVGHGNKNDELSSRLYKMVLVELCRLVSGETRGWWVECRLR